MPIEVAGLLIQNAHLVALGWEWKSQIVIAVNVLILVGLDVVRSFIVNLVTLLDTMAKSLIYYFITICSVTRV